MEKAFPFDKENFQNFKLKLLAKWKVPLSTNDPEMPRIHNWNVKPKGIYTDSRRVPEAGKTYDNMRSGGKELV